MHADIAKDEIKRQKLGMNGLGPNKIELFKNTLLTGNILWSEKKIRTWNCLIGVRSETEVECGVFQRHVQNTVIYFSPLFCVRGTDSS
jgi:hypothetical protein